MRQPQCNLSDRADPAVHARINQATAGVMRTMHARRCPAEEHAAASPFGIPAPQPCGQQQHVRSAAHLASHPLSHPRALLQLMVKENRLPIVFKDSRDARIGLLPLGSSSEADIRWFTLPPFMVFHTANAWEEEDGTVQVFTDRRAARTPHRGGIVYLVMWGQLVAGPPGPQPT
jgi:hypothetical protein